MEISKKLEKKINTITQLKGERPEEIEITKEEYDKLAREVQKEVKGFIEILNQDGQPLNMFMGVKLKIKE